MSNGLPTIVIDPGHGGSSAIGGSSPNNATGSNGLLEKHLSLDLARRLQRLLSSNARVLLTRTTDTNLSLSERARVARSNNALLFLSIHLNGFQDSQVDGTEVWIAHQANQQSRNLAQTVLGRLVAVTGVANRGVRQNNLGVLLPARHAPQTATCLAEIAFLTNPRQAQRLTEEPYKQQLAEAMAEAVRQHLRAPVTEGQAWAAAIGGFRGDADSPAIRTARLDSPEETMGEALATSPTLSRNARMEWIDLTLTRGHSGRDHLYCLTTGSPEGGPAIFNLKITNTNDVYNFENTFLNVRLSKKQPDGSFRTIPLRDQKGEYKRIRSEKIEDEKSRIIPIRIEREALLRAYHPDSPFTRLEVEFHWHEGNKPYYNRHSLAFYLVHPVEFLWNTNATYDDEVAFNDPHYKEYWTPIWSKEFSAADQTPLTIVSNIQMSVSEAQTDEITLTGSVTETRGQQRSVENTTTVSSKANFGIDDVVKMGLELQGSQSIKTSIGWNQSIARQLTEAARASRTFTQSFSKSLTVTSQISPAPPGKIKTLYLYPVFRLYKVKVARFEGPNRFGQATRRTEIEDFPVLLFSHWGDKQAETDARSRGTRGQAFDTAVAFDARMLAAMPSIRYSVPGGIISDPFYRNGEEKRRLSGRSSGRQAHYGIDVTYANPSGGGTDEERRGMPVYAQVKPSISIEALNSVRAARYVNGSYEEQIGLGIPGHDSATLQNVMVLVQPWRSQEDGAYGGVLGLAYRYNYTRANGASGRLTIYLEYLHLITPDFPPKNRDGSIIPIDAWQARGKSFGFGPRMQNRVVLSAAALTGDQLILIGYLGATQFPHVHIQAAYADGEQGYLRSPRFDPTIILQA